MFVFIYVYRCSTRSPYPMMVFRFLSTCRGGTTYPSEEPEFIVGFNAVPSQSLIFFIVLYRLLFVILLYFLFCQYIPRHQITLPSYLIPFFILNIFHYIWFYFIYICNFKYFNPVMFQLLIWKKLFNHMWSVR